MAIIIQKMGITIKSDKFTSLEEWAKTLPGAEELAKEKVQEERLQRKEYAQKYFQDYKKQNENFAPKEQIRKRGTTPIKYVAESKKDVKGVNKVSATKKDEKLGKAKFECLKSPEEYKKYLSKDVKRSIEIKEYLSNLAYASIDLKGAHNDNGEAQFNHRAYSFTKCYLYALVIEGKEILCDGWENALLWFSTQLKEKAVDRLRRWKRERLLEWLDFKDILKIEAPKKTPSKIAWKIEQFQWLLCMAGFKLEDIVVKFKVANVKKDVEVDIPLCLPRKRKGKQQVGHWQSVVELEAIEPRPPSYDGYICSPSGTVERIRTGNLYDHEIARSSSDSEDTWTGMGHFARDNGRFGSICGEDYAD